MDGFRVGVVELGSRAVRLLVADVDVRNAALVVVDGASRQTQLGGAVGATVDERRPIIRDTITAALEFLKQARLRGAREIKVFGTQAARRLWGIGTKPLPRGAGDFDVIDHEFEARCSMTSAALGLRRELPTRASLIVVDQGSGSTELVAGTMEKQAVRLDGWTSYPFGAEVLSAYVAGAGGELARAVPRIKSAADSVQFQCPRGSRMIGMGSTATKAAFRQNQKGPRHAYAAEHAHGQAVTLQDLEVLVSDCISDPERMRAELDPRDPEGPEYDLVAPGFVFYAMLMRKWGVSSFVATAWGTRHGLAYYLAHQAQRPRT